MNAPERQSVLPSRHRLTISDVLKMQDIGILAPDHHCELIEGDLVEMPSQGELRALLKLRLIRHFNRNLPDVYDVGPDTTLWLADDQGPEPDLFIFPAALSPAAVRGPDVLLLVEVADTSLAYDLGEKAELYRRFGVREYWIVDAGVSVTHRRVLDAVGAWTVLPPAPFSEPLTPTLLAEIEIEIAKLL